MGKIAALLLLRTAAMGGTPMLRLPLIRQPAADDELVKMPGLDCGSIGDQIPLDESRQRAAVFGQV